MSVQVICQAKAICEHCHKEVKEEFPLEQMDEWHGYLPVGWYAGYKGTHCWCSYRCMTTWGAKTGKKVDTRFTWS